MTDTKMLELTRDDCGCYVEGSWGQYGPDHLADRAGEFGWDNHGDPWADPRALRIMADALEAADGWEHEAFTCWEAHIEAADRIEEWLNARTPDGLIWHWHDGEFFLSPLCDDPDGCTDETCAHWD